MSKLGHKNAPKALVCGVFVELHSLHFAPATIARLTGFTGQYIRQVLADMGRPSVGATLPTAALHCRLNCSRTAMSC